MDVIWLILVIVHIDDFKFTPPNRQSFFSANISGYTVGSKMVSVCATGNTS